MQNKNGFTLIELIIVIVILGILSVTASPLFIDISTDARIAKLDALEGSMRSASELVNYKARIENKTDCLIDPTIEVAGESITLRCGYPCPHPNGITNSVDADEGFDWVGGNCAGRLGAKDVQITDAPDPSNCKIRYAAARSEDSSPIFTATTSGC
ncbi:prepilin-type N-terminal cleavage/methylation domain-containing protein [uncultured Paraglaciecola sp.]|uniref:prepilin-type N-terminal cleavage/methylation domain-containing protein n=1 Tax=uncultured Paraglaciecola sp. TaxID=1765024 RepID=UPI0025CE57BD|nr:prepilin-type N-terminal cleavage/methylation domain-containing protein [uncultured Paraglaciecola sp.]